MKGEKMPTVWFILKKSLDCKSADLSDIYEPRGGGHHGIPLGRKTCRSGCSRSIANLKDVVVHGSSRQVPASTCSPRSIGSSEFLNPISHEVVIRESKCELKITGFGGDYDEGGGGGRVKYSSLLSTLRPGTPGPGGRSTDRTSLWKQTGSFADREDCNLSDTIILSNAVHGNGGAPRASFRHGSSLVPSGSVTCLRCGEQFVKMEVLEAHHLTKHAVTELLEGDSSRKIVEIICKASWLKSHGSCGRLERILKVHNMQKTLARFEEYREMVKTRASKLPKKHPRCLADGNELLRFYGTTICCSLGIDGTSNLCISDKCNICCILRHGFSTRKELKGDLGVFTTSTSGRALESIQVLGDDPSLRKALLVCRVIAGRVHKAMDTLHILSDHSGFDSVAGKVGPYANIEDLYLLSTQALLPCFVVICRF